MTERVTVKPGDYVAFKDIETPEQATAIADAFIAAGATPGEGYPYADDNDACWDNLFWDKSGNATNRGSGGERRLAPRQIIGEPVTLAPGDYVSTAGMTEDQYHAVARAFMAAGAAGGEYPNYSYADKEISCARWSFGNRRGALWHGLSGCFDGRHLTPQQVVSATNAGNKEEDMTPCEKLGYKVGDVFEYTGGSAFPKGGKIRLSQDDGTNSPMFLGMDCNALDGDDWMYARIGDVKRIDGTTDPLTTILQSAREEADKAREHEAQAAQHRAKHDELMQQARDMLPDGWRLVRDDEPTEDLTDPANWREGDAVECLVNVEGEFTRGRGYMLREGCTGQWASIAEDDVGDKNGMRAERFRFHSRPTT